MSPVRAAFLSLLTAAGALASAALLGSRLEARFATRAREPGRYQVPAALAAIPPPERLERGRKLFLNSCAHCHGADARGDEGPDLHGLWVSERRIATVIHNGIRGEMPSFARKHDSTEIALLVGYVRSLQ